MKSWNFTPEQQYLRGRILEISHDARASHLGSALSVVDIIAAIFEQMQKRDRFVLSAGHSAVALYAVLEQNGRLNSPNLRDLHVHPDRDPDRGIDVSTGSLGHGLPIALGIALANRSRPVWVVSTDGEMAEGSMWESLRIASDHGIDNVRLFINANGFGAYGEIKGDALERRIRAFGWRVLPVDGHNPEQLRAAVAAPITPPGVPLAVIARTDSAQFPFLQGLDAHYYVMSDADYALARASLSGMPRDQSPKPE